MNTNNTKEAVARLTIVAGQTGGSKTFKPVNGKIIGCSIYYKGGDSPGFTGAMVKDAGGREISMLQSIDNYRNREASYFEGIKPLNIEACGEDYTFEVIATSAFATDFTGELIFYYAPETQD